MQNQQLDNLDCCWNNYTNFNISKKKFEEDWSGKFEVATLEVLWGMKLSSVQSWRPPPHPTDASRRCAPPVMEDDEIYVIKNLELVT